MTVAEVVKKLESLSSPENVAGRERYGIVTPKSLGIPTPILKETAREIKKQIADRHAFALELWGTGIYDARAIAFFVDDPKQVTERQMDEWALDFDNWATVDG